MSQGKVKIEMHGPVNKSINTKEKGQTSLHEDHPPDKVL